MPELRRVRAASHRAGLALADRWGRGRMVQCLHQDDVLRAYGV